MLINLYYHVFANVYVIHLKGGGIVVTLKDIANLCNVSVATVSRALNGQSDVNSNTAKRIRRLAQEMGYFPNAAARALKTNRSYNIGILYEDEIHHEYFSLLIDKIRTAAEKKGYDITFLYNSQKTTYYEHAKYRGLDGVIILQATFEAPDVMQLAGSDLPCVAIDYQYTCCPCVISDHHGSIDQLVRHAYEKGHRKIAFVHGQSGYITDQRLNGFYKSCCSLGLNVPPGFIQQANYHDPLSAEQATKALLALEERPTCILYPDDYSCLGAFTQLERMGLSIPHDMGIIGYDGIMLSTVIRPRLTTYRQDVQRKGETAVELLIQQIEAPDQYPTNECVVVYGELQPGGTV